MTKQCVLILAITALCSSIAQAALVESGTFDIDGSSGLNFTPIPWVSSNPYSYVYLWPFAADDLYTGPGSQYNLAQVMFSAGSFTVMDYGEKSGNLGIRVGNYTGNTQTFEASILTLDFTGGDSFDVYLPEFTFEKSENIFFWIAESGATYYARSSKGAGWPDMSAAEAMSAGDEYLAMVPEPATLLLLGLGGLIIRRLKFKNQI
jgi:hypothetical protein